MAKAKGFRRDVLDDGVLHGCIPFRVRRQSLVFLFAS